MQVVEGGAGRRGDRGAGAALRGRAGGAVVLRHEGAQHLPVRPGLHAPPRRRPPQAAGPAAAGARRVLGGGGGEELRARRGRPLHQGAGLVRL